MARGQGWFARQPSLGVAQVVIEYRKDEVRPHSQEDSFS